MYFILVNEIFLRHTTEMDKSYVKSIIEGLKSSSSTRVQESLHKIRNKIITNETGVKIFCDCGGLELLLPHLRKPNERVLDITLSILGNCCLEEGSSVVVGKSNSFGPLISILKTVCRDSIVGRTCRLIGNLAQINSNAEALHSHGAVSALTNLIESRDKNTSYPTLTMAVRAVRQLWMINDKREEMLALNAVRCIAILLTTECEAAGIIKNGSSDKEPDGLRKSQEELINGILKCLGYFTTYATIQCAEQIQGDGRGYQCLVALTRIYESLALKCLRNLCYMSSCRPLLGTAGFVECLVGILQKNSDISSWPEGSARTLAQLSGESVNRSRLRHCGGLALLVTAARSSHYALYALLQYIFDEVSFQILVNAGLISLLTDDLVNHLKTMKCEHRVIKEDENLIEQVTDIDTATRKLKLKTDTDNAAPPSQYTEISNKEKETHLHEACKNKVITKNDEELKVIIERDNMIVGFVDSVDSTGTDEFQSEDETTHKNKGLKRARSRSPKMLKKKPHLIRMASRDWSAGIYWEPKSPEWSPTSQQISFSGSASPNKSDRGATSPYSETNQSGFSPEYPGTSSKRPRWDWSPESGISSGDGNSSSPQWTEYQWSPSSSGGNASPCSNYEEDSDSEMSGRYSPVCSEPEGDEISEVDDKTKENNEVDSKKQQMDAINNEYDLEDDFFGIEDVTDHVGIPNDTKTCRIACVLVLLFRLSHGACSSYLRDEQASNQSIDLLTGNKCLSALLDYFERCKRPTGRAAKILTQLLSNPLCLMSCLKYKLALRLHNMLVNTRHSPTNCQQCKQIIKVSKRLLNQLRVLAESSYGIGEISHQLLKGTFIMKQTLCLTLPYIISNEKILKRFFGEYKALNLLFNMIVDCKESLLEYVTALSKLATNMHIKNPKTLERRFLDQIYVTYDPILDDLSAEDIVTFELDDKSTVQANKLFLCQNSEVFCAMLMGCFKESVEKNIRLKNVTKPALEYLLSLLHSGLENPKCDVKIFPMAKNLETNLEVLLLADRFLFEKSKGLLCSAILQFQMKPDNVDKIYVWSLNDGMGFLCVESVAYLLTGQMCEAERTRSFETIINLQYKEQWLDDIKSMISRQLEK